MGVPYFKYRTDRGEIVATGECSSAEQCYIQMDDPENEHVIIGVKADDSTQWVNEEGDLTDRPALDAPATASIVADGVAEVTFPLPAGTMVLFNGVAAVTDGDDFGFTTDIPGTYVFEFSPPFPFIPCTLTIEAAHAV